MHNDAYRVIRLSDTACRCAKLVHIDAGMGFLPRLRPRRVDDAVFIRCRSHRVLLLDFIKLSWLGDSTGQKGFRPFENIMPGESPTPAAWHQQPGVPVAMFYRSEPVMNLKHRFHSSGM